MCVDQAGGAPDGFVSVPCGRLDVASNERVAIMSEFFFLPARLDPSRMQEAFYTLLRAWPILAARLRKGAPPYPELWRLLVPDAAKLEELIEADRQSEMKTPRGKNGKTEKMKKKKEKGRKVAAPMFSTASFAEDRLDDLVPLVRFARNKPQGAEEPVLIPIDRAALLRTFLPPTGLTSVSDCLSRADAAIMSVHVANFADGSVFALTVPHVCFDEYGVRRFLEAYLGLLRGDAPPEQPPLGYDPFDVFRPQQAESDGADASAVAEKKDVNPPSIDEKPPMPSPPEGWRVLTLLDFLILAFYFAIDLLWTRPERRMRRMAVYIPAEKLAAIKAQAEEDVEREGLVGADEDGNEDGEAPVVISTGAALHAWIFKNDLARRVEVNPNRLVTTATLANMRYRLPKGLNSIHPGYLGNCLLPIAADLAPARDVVAQSLGHIAAHLRQSLQRKTDPVQLRDYLRWQVWRSTPPAGSGPDEDGGHRSNSMAVFFPPHAHFTIITDWSTFQLYDLDFSAGYEKSAVGEVKGKDQEEEGVLAIIVDAHTALHHRNAWTIAGGRNGERWLLGYLSDDERKHPSGWGRFAEAS
ncbi:hypothetical protein OC835_002875 [Tilletia horrida]|nr:hypothetical protein OC835_002875 [Tilletia horrida]